MCLTIRRSAMRSRFLRWGCINLWLRSLRRACHRLPIRPAKAEPIAATPRHPTPKHVATSSNTRIAVAPHRGVRACHRLPIRPAKAEPIAATPRHPTTKHVATSSNTRIAVAPHRGVRTLAYGKLCVASAAIGHAHGHPIPRSASRGAYGRRRLGSSGGGGKLKF